MPLSPDASLKIGPFARMNVPGKATSLTSLCSTFLIVYIYKAFVLVLNMLLHAYRIASHEGILSIMMSFLNLPCS